MIPGQIINAYLDNARIGCGYRDFVVAEVGRKKVVLLYPPTVTSLELRLEEIERNKTVRVLTDRSPVKMAKLIRANIRERKRMGLAMSGRVAQSALAALVPTNGETDMPIEIEPRTYTERGHAARAGKKMLGGSPFEVVQTPEGRFVFTTQEEPMKPITKKPPSAKNAKPEKTAQGPTGIERQLGATTGVTPLSNAKIKKQIDEIKKQVKALPAAKAPKSSRDAARELGEEIAKENAKPYDHLIGKSRKRARLAAVEAGKAASKPAKAPKAKPARKTPAKGKKTAGDAPTGFRAGSKQAAILELASRENGASEKEVCEALGWKKARTTIKRVIDKAGKTFKAEKIDGETRYFAG